MRIDLDHAASSSLSGEPTGRQEPSQSQSQSRSHCQAEPTNRITPDTAFRNLGTCLYCCAPEMAVSASKMQESRAFKCFADVEGQVLRLMLEQGATELHDRATGRHLPLRDPGARDGPPGCGAVRSMRLLQLARFKRLCSRSTQDVRLPASDFRRLFGAGTKR